MAQPEMNAKQRDAIVPWFEAAKDLGEYIGIRFGRIPPGSRTPEWTFLQHTEYDGVGGFAHLLRKGGADVGRLPQVKHPSEASRLSVLQLLPKFLSSRKLLPWADFSRGPTLKDPQTPPPAVAWHVFDEADTLGVRRVSRRLGVTVNSFLIRHLCKAIRPHLQDISQPIPLMVPVNMRGKIERASDTANFSSCVNIKVESYDSVYDIHRKIYQSLGRGEHWANWYAYEFGFMLTRGMKRALIRRNMAMAQVNLGSFSNLGDWDPEKKIKHPECQGTWLFSPPVLRCQPLGTGCVTFQNRLSLVMQLHPDVTTDPGVPEEWMQAWVKEIQLDVSSVLAGVAE